MTMSDANNITFDRPAYLEAVLALVPECVGVIDRDIRFTDLNNAGLAKFGVSRFDELPDDTPLSQITEPYRDVFRYKVKAALSGDTSAAGKPFRIELEAIDGDVHSMECRMSPLKDDSGNICAVVATSRDISDWQEALDLSEQTGSILESILATVPDAMIVIDEDGLITSFSRTAEKMFGYIEADMIGENVDLLMPQPHREKHDGYIKRYLKTGERHIIERSRTMDAQRSDGTSFPIQLSIGEAVIGSHRLFTGFIHDLTERHETEEKLRLVQSELMHASRLSAIGTLASSLAHELNQPLTAIANYLSTGRDMLTDISAENIDMVQQALDESATEAVRAGKIVHRLRDFVSKGEINMQVLSMAELVNHATTLGLIDARVKGVEYNFDIHPDINHVLADKVQIQQVMINLMRNAIEAMEHSPIRKLTISAHSAANNRVEFKVQDTGPGISPEVRDHLFEPFASTKGEGMGLGLSICKTIIEAHGGELELEDASEGGATFKFTLQKAPKEPSDAE